MASFDTAAIEATLSANLQLQETLRHELSQLGALKSQNRQRTAELMRCASSPSTHTKPPKGPLYKRWNDSFLGDKYIPPKRQRKEKVTIEKEGGGGFANVAAASVAFRYRAALGPAMVLKPLFRSHPWTEKEERTLCLAQKAYVKQRAYDSNGYLATRHFPDRSFRSVQDKWLRLAGESITTKTSEMENSQSVDDDDTDSSSNHSD